MKWFQLITELLPLAEEIAKAIADAIAAGKTHETVSSTLSDHLMELPAKLRAA